MTETERIQCAPEAILQGEKYRISILTDRLFRLEYSEEGVFEDRPTQAVTTRCFPKPKFEVQETADWLEVKTTTLSLSYNKQAFSRNGLYIEIMGIPDVSHNVWHYGDPINDFLGTTRTLDTIDGKTPLEHGLMSWFGFTVYDDGASMALTPDGWIEPRTSGGTDLYFFGYGHDYLGCLRDFYHLCGATPLLPRYALGNWWSRYYKYTDAEYRALMTRFEEEGIPLAVSVIDMDWHLVDIDPKYGTGWTGYTWNKDFFPDPKGFMAWLHERGLHVTLNVHPADGIYPHEDCYPAVARAMGVDPATEEHIPFDPTSKKFFDVYFKEIHHPLEEEGVDFWWMDWQQGNTTRLPGLDPLWMLNHYHYEDNKRTGKRPLLLSRYAGIGSHRYPVGFSGDTIVTWASLDFQPYFTANSSNVGYGWWSHDIGGHMGGYKDDELATRWVQFGVFSPILRLHSSCCPFNSKEPWRFNAISAQIMKDFLRLRHQLIPYLYSMNRLSSRDALPLVRPMYYHHSENRVAYTVPNEFYFGTEMIVCPLTQPVDKNSLHAEFKAWLPEGLWTDFFTGRVYTGGRTLSLFRNLHTMPVLVRAGGILPLAQLEGSLNTTGNPRALEVHIFGGADGSFHLYEDDDSALDKEENWADTKMELVWGNQPKFILHPCTGNTAAAPAQRNYALVFRGLSQTPEAVLVNGQAKKVDYKKESDRCTVLLQSVTHSDTVVVIFPSAELAANDILGDAHRFLDDAQMSFSLKETIYNLISKNDNLLSVISSIEAMDVPATIKGPLYEIFTAR